MLIVKSFISKLIYDNYKNEISRMADPEII